ncbi:MAG: hypothetical protein KUG81_09200 [Gammaproteobacteria bacterium]|nr:hypothetical protein [Gammaproteobacteria bacterium]
MGATKVDNISWKKGADMINGHSWDYHIHDHSVVIRYVSPCGEKLQKTASNNEILELHGCLIDGEDSESTEILCQGIIDEESIVPAILGVVGKPH